VKRLSIFLLAALFLQFCTGCSAKTQRYSSVFLDVFDTVTEVVIYTDSPETGETFAQQIHDSLLYYHKLTDIYHEYPDMVNLCTVNKTAGREKVSIPEELMELLCLSQKLWEESNGAFNICMGSVLQLWEVCRSIGSANPELAALPSELLLSKAMEHIDPDMLLLDTQNHTVRFLDPDMQLDVGAIAKGWSVQKACEAAKNQGYNQFLISAGHNVSCVGMKDNQNWKVAVENPNGDEALMLLRIHDQSAVTSGGYQRYYTVDGQQYHHIIDPETGYPGERYQMVTVLCEDSGIADGLSTALFLMEQDSGAALAAAYDAEVLWVFPDGTCDTTAGFSDFE